MHICGLGIERPSDVSVVLVACQTPKAVGHIVDDPCLSNLEHNVSSESARERPRRSSCVAYKLRDPSSWIDLRTKRG